jgi:membrane protease YdiL (CAAX protease family)
MLSGQMMSIVLLVAVAALLAWFLRNDLAEYEAFKALDRTEDRQRVFRRWILKSFLLFGGAALAVLIVIGRLDALLTMPAEFAPVSNAIAECLSSDDEGSGLGAGLLIGMGLAAVVGGIFGGVIARRRPKPDAPSPSQAALGDIQPLFPRNGEERKWTALLAVNAGPGEELLFRLVVPLLLTQATGQALLSFVLAALVFGLVHLYQGWLGVLVTTLAGAAFTLLYLATGSIWIAVLVHSLMNLNSLWLQPLLQAKWAAR